MENFLKWHTTFAVWQVRDYGRFLLQVARKVQANHKPSNTTETLICYTACCAQVLFFFINIYESKIIKIIPKTKVIQYPHNLISIHVKVFTNPMK